MDQPAIEELVVGRALFVEDREDLAILQPLADGVEFGGEVGSVHGPSYRAPPLAPRRSRIGPGLAMRRRALAGARDTPLGNSPAPGSIQRPANPDPRSKATHGSRQSPPLTADGKRSG